MEAETSQTNSTETFYKVMAWLHANRKRLLIGLGVAAGLGLIAGIMAWQKSQTDADANAQFFALPVTSAPNTPMIMPTPSAYLDLAGKYPNTSAGEYAVLLAAESLFVDGNYPEAQHQFSKFIEDHPESPLVAQAKVGVAACLEAGGKTTDAIQKYQELISVYANEISITAPARLTLARLFEQQNRPDQALTLYAELARSQNPYDPWAAEARERGQLLLANHPELRKTEAAPAPTPFSVSQPLNPAGSAPAAAAPAPETKTENPPVNLLSIPGVSSNTPGKP